MRKKGRKKERENNEKKKVGVGGKVRLIMAFVGPIVAFYKCHYRFL